MVGGSYDADGNMLTAQGTTLGYDVANGVWYAIVAAGWEYYGYAPDNKRIWSTSRTGATLVRSSWRRSAPCTF
jgi:hypothetical protein